jgi:capsular polysaccharide biosynthesis protein
MYFHWLTDALTRLVASEQFVANHKVILPHSYQEYPFIRESLEYLGYSIHWLLPSERLRVDELVLPSHTASPGNFNDELLKRVRDKFCLHETLQKKLIYISRAKASRRFIENEEELIHLLLDYSFEIHVFEDYSFSKQVELMNQTEVLIGLHGAGLTNMLFMKQQTKVVEIRNQNDSKNNCYFSMASALELSYYYVEGTGSSSDTADAIIKVNIEHVKRLFQQMGLKSENAKS